MPSSRARPRTPDQLPPGRHKLSREYVAANQRQRILDAIADVTSLAGYTSMSVEDIIATAGVSRRTFYDNFSSKEDAFLAALDVAAAEMVERVQMAYDANRSFARGVRDSLAAFVGFMVREPRYADMLIVEVLAAGPAAIQRRNEVMGRFAEMLRAGAETLPSDRRPPALTAETIIGGIYEIVYSRVLQGQLDQLPALLPDLVYSMLQPYVGHEAAKREAARARSLAASGSGVE